MKEIRSITGNDSIVITTVFVKSEDTSIFNL